MVEAQPGVGDQLLEVTDLSLQLLLLQLRPFFLFII
jgi:hypothetical protein